MWAGPGGGDEAQMRERGEDEPAGGLGGPSGPEPGELDRGEKGEADGALCEGEDE